jgi:protein N-terminal glutamine amidohydrolase
MAHGALVFRKDPNSYTSCYCEENTFKLGQRMIEAGSPPDSLFALFISNESKSVAIFRQQSANEAEDGLVVWDYHVCLVEVKGKEKIHVWDLDSSLPFGCPLSTYLTEAFRDSFEGQALVEEVRPRFRVVPMKDYLDCFASDRHHMRAEDEDEEVEGVGMGEKGWKAPPPIWPCIQGPKAKAIGLGHNLDRYWEVVEDEEEEEEEGKEGAVGKKGAAGVGDGLRYGFTCSLEELSGRLMAAVE